MITMCASAYSCFYNRYVYDMLPKKDSLLQTNTEKVRYSCAAEDNYGGFAGNPYSQFNGQDQSSPLNLSSCVSVFWQVVGHGTIEAFDGTTPGG